AEMNDHDLEAVKERCVFTTHTPVPAGPDKSPVQMVRSVLGDDRVAVLEQAGGIHEAQPNMTHLAVHLTRFVNGAAMRHPDASRGDEARSNGDDDWPCTPRDTVQARRPDLQ